VLYSRDASKQPPYYPSTKCLVTERDTAAQDLILFNDIPLDRNRQQLQPPDQVQHIPRLRNRFLVFFFTSAQDPQPAGQLLLHLRPRIMCALLACVLLGVLLPAVREAVTLDDMDWLDFSFVFDRHCNYFLYIFNHQSCGVWPAYMLLSLFFLLVAPLILLNRHHHTLFAHLPAVIAMTNTFRQKVLGVSLSDTLPAMRCTPQITMAVHPLAPHLATLVHNNAAASAIHFYKMEAVVQRPQPGRPVQQLELDDKFWRALAQDKRHVTAM
jgi:hypothetical protein